MFVPAEVDQKLSEGTWMWAGRPPGKFEWGISRREATGAGKIPYDFVVPRRLAKKDRLEFGKQLRTNLGTEVCDTLGKIRLDALLRQFKKKSQGFE
jgi:hypothetical protein